MNSLLVFYTDRDHGLDGFGADLSNSAIVGIQTGIPYFRKMEPFRAMSCWNDRRHAAYYLEKLCRNLMEKVSYSSNEQPE